MLDAVLSPPGLALGALVLLLVLFFIWNSRPMPIFVPPKMHPIALWVGRMLLPWRIRFTDRVTRVEVDDESLERLRVLAGQRVVICPNHSYRADADMVLHLSGLLGQDWYFLSALENFTPRVQGWFLQHVGVYSVIRGTMDKPSFRMTRQLLAEGERWLVLFPEGEICGLNDAVGLFQPGVAQFGFWALDDLCEQHPDTPPPPLYLAPIAIKYLLPADVRPSIMRSLTRLERRLGITNPSATPYARLVEIGEAVLSATEREYGMRHSKEMTFDTRIQQGKRFILDRVAGELGVTLRTEQPLLDQVRALFNAVDKLMREEPAETPYARQLQQQHQRRAKTLYQDLWRVLRFVALYDGYVHETMSVERFCELINRLEWEVFGKMRWIGPQLAVVRAGTPINLTEHLEAYRRDKRGTLAALVGGLEAEVRGMISELSARSTPLPEVAMPIGRSE